MILLEKNCFIGADGVLPNWCTFLLLEKFEFWISGSYWRFFGAYLKFFFMELFYHYRFNWKNILCKFLKNIEQVFEIFLIRVTRQVVIVVLINSPFNPLQPSVAYLYPLENIRELLGFLMFSGGIDKERLALRVNITKENLYTTAITYTFFQEHGTSFVMLLLVFKAGVSPKYLVLLINIRHLKILHENLTNAIKFPTSSRYVMDTIHWLCKGIRFET